MEISYQDYYPFKQMKIDQSFHVPAKYKSKRDYEMKMILVKIKEQKKMKFTVIETDENDSCGSGIRCWRVS